MSPLDNIPNPWRTAMEEAGTYSLRELAARANLGTTTVSTLIFGRAASSEPTMQAVADSLRLPVTTIRTWATAARGEDKPFELPAEANRLSRRERDAVLAVIRAMLDPGRGEETPMPDFSHVQGIRLMEDPSLDPTYDRNPRG